MPFSRYNRTPTMAAGQQLSTARAIEIVRRGISNGNIKLTNQIVMRGDERLDTIAGEVYGDARYWWVLAAASDIGWCLQCPPGTIINIPDLSDVAALIG